MAIFWWANHGGKAPPPRDGGPDRRPRGGPDRAALAAGIGVLVAVIAVVLVWLLRG